MAVVVNIVGAADTASAAVVVDKASIEDISPMKKKKHCYHCSHCLESPTTYHKIPIINRPSYNTVIRQYIPSQSYLTEQ